MCPGTMQDPHTPATILVLDDEPAIRRLHERYLAVAGYRCIGVETLADALRTLQEQPIDVALLDVRLASGNGLLLAHNIREYFPGTATIMITGLADVATATEAMRAGAIDYIVKPVSADTLRKSVAHVLHRAQGDRSRTRLSEQLGAE